MRNKPETIASTLGLAMVGAAVLVLVPGCGADAPRSDVPSFREAPDAELDRAESQINALFGAGPSGAQQQYAQPPGPSQQQMPSQPGQTPPPSDAASPPPPPPTEVTAGGLKGGGREGIQTSPCETACRALASMMSATDRLCSIAGDSDARCANARTRTKNATSRVRASCPDCAK